MSDDSSREVRLGAYVRALQTTTLDQLGGRGPLTCPHCRKVDPRRLTILVKGEARCATCVPSTRFCRGCKAHVPIEQFDVRGPFLNSPCQAYRRTAARDRYQERKDIPPSDAPKTCTRCGETKPADDFPRGALYRGGRMTWCVACHTAWMQDYQAGAGAETYARAQRRHRQR